MQSSIHSSHEACLSSAGVESYWARNSRHAAHAFFNRLSELSHTHTKSLCEDPETQLLMFFICSHIASPVLDISVCVWQIQRVIAVLNYYHILVKPVVWGENMLSLQCFLSAGPVQIKQRSELCFTSHFCVYRKHSSKAPQWLQLRGRSETNETTRLSSQQVTFVARQHKPLSTSGSI